MKKRRLSLPASWWCLVLPEWVQGVLRINNDTGMCLAVQTQEMVVGSRCMVLWVMV